MELRPASLVFKVRRGTPELISPAKPTPRELKILSDIDDQEGVRMHLREIYFYRHKHNPSPIIKRNNNYADMDPVGVIRKALEETLVYYYPFAGRLHEGPNRKLMVDCNNEGVVFVEADADVTLEEFGDYLHPPFPCVEDLFTNPSCDVLQSPLLLIQVTRLKCGGFILGLSFNHVMCDGVGLGLFLETLAEMARGANAPSVPPVWDRHLLNARVPPRVTFLHPEYDQSVAETADTIPHDRMVQRCFFFGPKEISTLRTLVPSDFSGRSTSSELLKSLLWRCRTIALRPLPHTETRFGYVVNARPRLHSPPLPPGYYGNASVFPSVVATAEELSERPLEFALRLVQEAKSSVTDEYVRSLADLLATRGRPSIALVRTYGVSDVRRLGFEDIDFGWGTPVYGGPADAQNNGSFLIAYKNKEGESGILVTIILPELAMKRFAEELARVLDNKCVSSQENNSPNSIRSSL